MNKSKLIIVNGQSGSGKTTLSRKISEQFNLPLINKDTLKEIIFDDLGYSNRDWSMKVGATTYRLIDYFIEEQLRAGHNLIVESNFKPKFDDTRFQDWQEKYDFYCLQMFLYADKKVLAQRFRERNIDGERHPGHDEDNFDWQTLIDQPLEPLNVKGQTLKIDTTDFKKIDYKKLETQLKNLID